MVNPSHPLNVSVQKQQLQCHKEIQEIIVTVCYQTVQDSPLGIGNLQNYTENGTVTMKTFYHKCLLLQFVHLYCMIIMCTHTHLYWILISADVQYFALFLFFTAFSSYCLLLVIQELYSQPGLIKSIRLFSKLFRKFHFSMNTKQQGIEKYNTLHCKKSNLYW